MTVPERLSALRKIMKEKGITMLIVPTADFHQSEYVGEHFKERMFITGFTGSAGTALIGLEEARLWTDGRYFIQAAKQLEGTTVQLMKMFEPGVPSLEAFLEEHLKEGDTLAFDGRAVSVGEGQEYARIAEKKKAKILYDEDFVDPVWKDRPALSEEPAFDLDEKYAGESVSSKMARIRKEMEDAGCNTHIVSTLDDTCWTLNIRGNDIEFFPLVLSYAIVRMDRFDLYIDERKLDKALQEKLAKDGVVLHPYNAIYEDVKKLSDKDIVMIDPSKLNYALFNNIPKSVKTVEKRNPAILMKAIKNPVEIENIRKAQIKDSVAHLRFMKWLKENIGKIKITEMSAAAKLDEFRAEMGNFIRPSFEPISSFGPHSAIVHYTSSPETDVEFHTGTLYLSDTGAGFYEGSTDITRTFALGEVPQQMKDDFTLVAISNLHLANAKFLEGCSGLTLDILCRQPFWDRNLNFNHGTGHGVGFVNTVHEMPTSIRNKINKDVYRNLEFEPGMIMSDEPGVYISGKHGIRMEILMNVVEKQEGFLGFESLTMAPIDSEPLLVEVMTKKDIEFYNKYQREVYEAISYGLNEEEKAWLKELTKEI